MRAKKYPAGSNQTGKKKKAEANLQPQNTTPPTARQRIKQRITCSACMENIPASWATWLIQELGLRHA